MLHGAGGNFCSGGDVHEIIGPLIRLKAPELLMFTRMTGELVKTMRRCPQPIVAAIDGVCAGAGAILAMASDLRWHGALKTAFLFNRVGLAGCDMGACASCRASSARPRVRAALHRPRDGRRGTGPGASSTAWWRLRPCLPTRRRWRASSPARPHLRQRHHQDHAAPGMGDGCGRVDRGRGAQAQALCMLTEDFSRAYRAFVAKQKPVFQGD